MGHRLVEIDDTLCGQLSGYQRNNRLGHRIHQVRAVLPEVAIILLEKNFTVFENQQAICVLMRGNIIDRLFASLEGNRKISNEIIAFL